MLSKAIQRALLWLNVGTLERDLFMVRRNVGVKCGGGGRGGGTGGA